MHPSGIVFFEASSHIPPDSLTIRNRAENLSLLSIVPGPRESNEENLNEFIQAIVHVCGRHIDILNLFLILNIGYGKHNGGSSRLRVVILDLMYLWSSMSTYLYVSIDSTSTPSKSNSLYLARGNPQIEQGAHEELSHDLLAEVKNETARRIYANNQGDLSNVAPNELTVLPSCQALIFLCDSLKKSMTWEEITFTSPIFVDRDQDSFHMYFPFAHCGAFNDHCVNDESQHYTILKAERKQCGRCKATAYCSKAHQQLNWPRFGWWLYGSWLGLGSVRE
ncbi:hypothetical protein C8R43DRAFT_966009 [Mycena crocata]|nr:hypothetical protein C8R43DRAFT_966230 [Mycena crocata]KAJ7076803.1 hypothetical protein C8R43DRAFT_966162 [Mycena crocata]KAJ7078369.1 hypothetical protein C8R43DRAFT_966009 [Mycena crocata]